MNAARRRRALSLIWVAALCLGLMGIAPTPAAGDEIGDKRAEAERIAAQVDALNQRIEVLAEQYNAAQEQLAQVEADQAAAQTKVDQTKAEQAEAERQLAAYAVQAYVRGGDSSTLPVILGSDGSDIGQRQGYLSAAAGNRQDLLDRLEAVRQDVEADVARLEAAKAEAERVKSDIDAKKSATQTAADQQRSLLAKAQGELATLLQQEQARRAAAAAAAAKARADAAAQTHTAPPPSGGGGGGGGGGSSDPPPGLNGGAAGAVAEAQRQIGVRYTWGGASPETGFDCSGLTMWSWRVGGGVSLPHSSSGQYAATTHIPLSSIQPGDLIFYGHPIHHVAIYVGGGQIIHAPHAGSSVSYDSLYYWDELVGAGRV